MNSIEMIDDLITQVKTLYPDTYEKRDIKGVHKFHARAQMILSNLLEKDSPYIANLLSVCFWGNLREYGYDTTSMSVNDMNYAYNEIWVDGIEETISQLELIKEKLVLFGNQQAHDYLNTSKKVTNTKKVFIVHGHNNEMKVSVARSLEKLGFEPVVLHEQPNIGRTIIEKFEEHSDVGYAIVLLSPDDFGNSRKEPSSKSNFRARQNVILELGYFLGKLGRQRVMALYLQENNFEMPSDFSGVLYVPFDNEGKWQFSLVQELKACGYKVDANKLI